MNNQEQEHCDYENGCRSEFQNAFDYNRMQTDLDPDAEEIAVKLSMGLFVVVLHYPVCCQSTDAYIGMKRVCDRAFVERKDAEEYVNDVIEQEKICPDSYIEVLPRLVQEEYFSNDSGDNQDDVPF